MRQVTTELYLYKGDQCHGTRYAVCSNATGTCVATTASQDRLTPHNMTVVLCVEMPEAVFF